MTRRPQRGSRHSCRYAFRRVAGECVGGARDAALALRPCSKSAPETLAGRADVWFKIDADVSFESDHLETITRGSSSTGCSALQVAFALTNNPGDGITTGQRACSSKRNAVRTASSASPQLTPLERSLGWDTIDIAEAVAKGWRTIVVDETSFVHHRLLGARERSRWRYHWREGAVAHRLRYRPGLSRAASAASSGERPYAQ